MNVDELVMKGALVKEPEDPQLIKKELDEADSDLNDAEQSFAADNHKWAIIQSYYAMFHAAKAVLFSLGLREKKHYAITLVLERLSKDGKLEHKYVNDFAGAQHEREEADYNYNHGEQASRYAVNAAREFLARMKLFLKR